MSTPQGNSHRTMDCLLDRVQQLHSSPIVACQILSLLKDPEFQVGEIAVQLEADPALAASILRLVNSSCLGLSHKIASLPQAVTYIGARSLRLAVLSFGLVDHLTRGTPVQVCHDYWRRALTMAAVASHLCTDRTQTPPDEAYSAGLLADIGVLIFAQADTERPDTERPDTERPDTERYLSLYAQYGHGRELVMMERRDFGFDHAALGARLLSRWNLPTQLTRAVAGHDRDDRPSNSVLERAVLAADMLADVLWTPQTPRLAEAQRFLTSHFGLDLDGFISLALTCKADVARNAESFRVELAGSIDCAALRKQALSQYKTEAMETAMDWDSLTAVKEHDCS